MVNSPKELIRWARDRGWSASKTSHGHWRLRHANGSTVVIPSTPGDWRSLHNAKANLKRAEQRPTKLRGKS
jgi:predicted RNA binding protein YcfA (HicA-like mRNA interferase family)